MADDPQYEETPDCTTVDLEHSPSVVARAADGVEVECTCCGATEFFPAAGADSEKY